MVNYVALFSPPPIIESMQFVGFLSEATFLKIVNVWARPECKKLPIRHWTRLIWNLINFDLIGLWLIKWNIMWFGTIYIYETELNWISSLHCCINVWTHGLKNAWGAHFFNTHSLLYLHLAHEVCGDALLCRDNLLCSCSDSFVLCCCIQHIFGLALHRCSNRCYSSQWQQTGLRTMKINVQITIFSFPVFCVDLLTQLDAMFAFSVNAALYCSAGEEGSSWSALFVNSGQLSIH